MDIQTLQILETLIILAIYIAAFFLTKFGINNTLKRTQLERARRKMIIKAIHLLSTITMIVLVASVWGLEQNKIALIAGAILTTLGIAFFAQWSLLSNITSSIILFFNHPLKLGDTIKVLDKDYPFEGEVIELTSFFLYLKTKNGDIITVPNSIVLQKPILITGSHSPK
jgi:small-conductance mechanosensitive channel